jgi:hypothetical protein
LLPDEPELNKISIKEDLTIINQVRLLGSIAGRLAVSIIVELIMNLAVAQRGIW